MIKVTIITITFIFILFSGLGLNDLKYYENRINVEERLQQLESQFYDFSQSFFMIPLIYASSDDDDDEDDKNDDDGKDDDNVNELEKQKNAKRDFDMSMAELMDTVDQFKTSDFVYICHMKDAGHFKQEVDCLDWAMNDPNPEESIKNFAILKGAGLYD